MKRKAINKIGKVGTANQIARRRIAEIAQEKCLDYCEVGFVGCMNTIGLAPAHHRPRSWYKGDVDKLSDYKYWLSCCMACHTRLDSRSQTTQEESDEIFKELRGYENTD
jgi:hypothetical protein